VRREGITEAAGHLQHAGIISYRRGHITVLDRAGLESRVCECYGVIRREFDSLLSEVENHQATLASRANLSSRLHVVKVKSSQVKSSQVKSSQVKSSQVFNPIVDSHSQRRVLDQHRQ